MSKSQVHKSNKSRHKTKDSVVSIAKILDKGRRVNYLRSLEEPAVDTCHCTREKKEFPQKFYICKILYPPERPKKYPECDHANDIVPNRDILTHEKYMQLLAMPKKVITVQQLLLRGSKLIDFLATTTSPHAAMDSQKYSTGNRTR